MYEEELENDFNGLGERVGPSGSCQIQVILTNNCIPLIHCVVSFPYIYTTYVYNIHSTFNSVYYRACADRLPIFLNVRRLTSAVTLLAHPDCNKIISLCDLA